MKKILNINVNGIFFVNVMKLMGEIVMSTVTRYWLEEARKSVIKERDLDKLSNRQLAFLLDITEGYMSKLLNERNDYEANPELAFKIAQLAKVDPMQIVGAINAKTSKSEESKSYWKKLEKGAIAGLATISLSGALLNTPKAEAAPSPTADNKPALYIMLNSTFDKEIDTQTLFFCFKINN